MKAIRLDNGKKLIMKNLHFIFVALLYIISQTGLQAQEKEYLVDGSKKLQVSGFISLIQEFSSYESDFAFSSGGSFGVLFNQNFYVGAYGLGMIKPGIDLRNDNFDEFNASFGHGGLMVGGIINTEKAIHFDVNTKIGLGGYSYEGDLNYIDEYDAVFVVSPEVGVELNITKFLKVKAGVGYRYVTGFKANHVNDNILNSTTGSIGILLGWFGQSKSNRMKQKEQIDADQIRL